MKQFFLPVREMKTEASLRIHTPLSDAGLVANKSYLLSVFTSFLNNADISCALI
jgi:hypothetical protein